MKLVKGNLWDSKDDVILVTGNSYIRKDGGLVMGRGAAKELLDSYPYLQQNFGEQITNSCGSMGKYGLLFKSIVYYLFVPERKKVVKTYGVFQVKYHFRADAELELIQYSTDMLTKCSLPGDVTFSMNFPGIGWGRLKREDVLPILQKLPDCVTIYEYEEK